MKNFLFLILAVSIVPSVKSFGGEMESRFQDAKMLNTTAPARSHAVFTHSQEFDFLAATFNQAGPANDLSASDLSEVEFSNDSPFGDSASDGSGSGGSASGATLDTIYFKVKQTSICSWIVYSGNFSCIDKKDASSIPVKGGIYLSDRDGKFSNEPVAVINTVQAGGSYSKNVGIKLTSVEGSFKSSNISVRDSKKKSLKGAYDQLFSQNRELFLAASLATAKAQAAETLKNLFLNTLDVMELEKIDPSSLEFKDSEEGYNSWTQSDKSYPVFYFKSQKFGYCQLNGQKDRLPGTGDYILGNLTCFDQQGKKSLYGRYHGIDSFYVESINVNTEYVHKHESVKVENGKFILGGVVTNY